MQPSNFNLFALFNLLCGLSLFLYGMKFGEKGLRKISGNRLKTYISFLTKNQYYGLVAGVVVTFLTQSSSATSVMLVGLTSAGLMTLAQSVGMLLGADIGTTLTVQLYSFKIYHFAPLMIALGFYLFAFGANLKRQRLGQILMAFGMIFFGMKMMSNAVAPLQHNRIFLEIFRASLASPFPAILVSAVFTAIVQSSAATIAIVLAFAVPDGGGIPLVDINTAIPLIFGANIGTCATALLASIRTTDEARRVAWAHTLFKVVGVVLFFPFIKYLALLCQYTSTDPIRQIANAHSIFNVAIALIFIPLVHQFVRVVMRLVPEKEQQDERFKVKYIDKQVFNLPTLALGQATREVMRMSGIVTGMVEETMSVFIENKEELRYKVVECDDQVDFLHEAIVPYLSRLSQEELTPEQSCKEIQLLAVTTELEQTADVVSKNLMQFARKKIETGFRFSEEGWKEIKEFHSKTLINIQTAVTAFALNNMEMAKELLSSLKTMDTYYEKMRTSHIARLHKGLQSTMDTTTIHLDLLDDMHLINLHARRIALLVRECEVKIEK